LLFQQQNKTNSKHIMKTTASFITAALLLTGVTAFADKARLTTGHLDIAVGYEDGAFTLSLHDDTTDTGYDAKQAIVVVAASAKTTVVDDPAFGFLGDPDEPVWILPEVQNPDLAFLGFGADDLASGVFSNDIVRVTLLKVTGPGEMALYNLDAFGAPRLVMNTRDGIYRNDRIDMVAGGDAHQNFAFSKAGVYHVTFQATGTLLDGTVIQTKKTTYLIEVLRK
jgi:surface-anchored protein